LIYICRKNLFQSDFQVWRCSCYMNNQSSHEIQLNVFSNADTFCLCSVTYTVSVLSLLWNLLQFIIS
jgi:hypothetical protein